MDIKEISHLKESCKKRHVLILAERKLHPMRYGALGLAHERAAKTPIRAGTSTIFSVLRILIKPMPEVFLGRHGRDNARSMVRVLALTVMTSMSVRTTVLNLRREADAVTSTAVSSSD